MYSSANSTPRILLVIDDVAERRGHEATLLRAGFFTSAPGDLSAAQQLCSSFTPDVIVADTHGDPQATVRTLRAETDRPLLFLLDKQDGHQCVPLFHDGVDDVVFSSIPADELIARCTALLRRRGADDFSTARPPANTTLGPLEVDTARHQLRLDGHVVNATRIEFALIEQLARNPGRVITREELLEGVWGPHWVGDSHGVDVHLSNLRRKLSKVLPDVSVIRTVRGVGFRISDEILRRMTEPNDLHQLARD